MRFSLITLNCFGAPTPSTHARLLALAHALNCQDASVVCLQEVQANYYRRLLVAACTGYPAHAFAPFVHAPKGGLLTLSRLPIQDHQFVLYRERSLWYSIAPADWILHKGVLCTRLTAGSAGSMDDSMPVIVLNTHLTANYGAFWHRYSPYVQIERTQLQHLADIVGQQPPEALVIVAGDFNVPRGSWLYQEFIRATGLTDPLADSQVPTLRPPRGMPDRYKVPIDYALFRAPALPGLQVRSRLCFDKKIPLSDGRLTYASDHIGIQLELSWEELAAKPSDDTLPGTHDSHPR